MNLHIISPELAHFSYYLFACNDTPLSFSPHKLISSLKLIYNVEEFPLLSNFP